LYAFVLCFQDFKSEIGVKCVVAMLPAPPKRGLKHPKMSPGASVEELIVDFEVTFSVLCV